MRGLSLAVVGVMASVCWTILRQPGVVWSGWLIAVGALLLAASRRVNLIVILGLAGAVGYLIYW